MSVKKKLTKADLEQKVLYFCYGSNMNQKRIEARVGPVTFVTTYNLEGYALVFNAGEYNNFANIIQSKNDYCEGVIYEMTYEQLRKLDMFEGLYKRIKFKYKDRLLHTYVAFFCSNSIPKITEEYLDHIEKGCIKHNLLKSLEIVRAIQIIPAFNMQKYFEYYYGYWE